MIIKVPVGKKIRFDETVEKVNSFNIRIGEQNKRRWDRDWDFDYDYYFDYRTNVDYTMGTDGQLTDPGGKPMQRNNPDYRYQPDTAPNDSIDIRQELENEKRKKEESERRIRELEQRQNANQPKTTTLIRSFKKSSAGKTLLARGPSPVSTMSEWF